MLILRSLFGFTGDALLIDLPEGCDNCDPAAINDYVNILSTHSLMSEDDIPKLKGEMGPQGDAGERRNRWDR